MISIIIPIYNAEKYLRQCLDSILDQHCDSAEVILINDGSTDNSLNICREYASRDSRFLVIDKPNSGVSDTRNTGINHAQGEYILFVDADDIMVSGALQKICRALDERADMLIWGFSSFGERKALNDTKFLCKHPDGFESEELLKHLISTEFENRLIGVVWRCAFKRMMLNSNNIRFFRELKMSEDFKFMLEAVHASSRISVLCEELYLYRVNGESVTARYKKNVHTDMLQVNKWMETEICNLIPGLEVGLCCCCAETYITTMQNLCNPGTVYNLWERIGAAWKIRSEYGYTQKIKTASLQKNMHSAKRRLVYYMLRMRLEPLYIFLFSIKRRTLFEKNVSQENLSKC